MNKSEMQKALDAFYARYMNAVLEATPPVAVDPPLHPLDVEKAFKPTANDIVKISHVGTEGQTDIAPPKPFGEACAEVWRDVKGYVGGKTLDPSVKEQVSGEIDTAIERHESAGKRSFPSKALR